MKASNFEINRAVKIIKEVIHTLSIDLKGFNVLTEAGSNYFIYTPLIAYYAGASKVYVWTKDTKYGMGKTILNELLEIIKFLKIPEDSFEFAVNERPEEHISSADIVTNLGFVRPINKEFIDLMKPGGVVSYMCEAWEVRPEDVSIDYCKERMIPVAGVWENHPDLLIFNNCGALAAKLCFEAGMEIFQNKILITSSDKFGEVARDTFNALGASEVLLIPPHKIQQANFANLDILFVADYTYSGDIIGPNLEHSITHLKECAIVHLCGSVDHIWLEEMGLMCYPNQEGYPFRMTRTLAHLGLNPVLKLHGAGLKVGECLVRGETNELVQII
jgi:hypothetical protein